VENAIIAIKTQGAKGLMSAALDLGDALFTIVGIVNGDCTDEVNDSEALVDKITSILDELKDIKTNWPALLERLKKNK